MEGVYGTTVENGLRIHAKGITFKDDPTDLTAIEGAYGVFENTLGLVQRLENLVERLVGPWPVSAASSEAPQGVPSGVLPQLFARTDHVRQRVRDAHEAIDRLERAIP